MARRYRRLSARPNENEIPTVRITKPRSNPHRRGRRRNAPITKAQARVLKRILRKHGFGVNPVGSDGWYFNYNPKRGTRRGKKHHMARKARRVKRNPKPPKGKRAGSVFKRKGKWFRISIVKVKKGRKTVKRRVTRKTTARAAKRARK